MNIPTTPHNPIPRPETPPPSTHRLEIPISPESPTHSPLHHPNNPPTSTGGASLFDDDDNKPLSQPPTPVLYNLIRNEGPPRFVIAPQQVPKPAPPEMKEEVLVEEESSHFVVDVADLCRDGWNWR